MVTQIIDECELSIVMPCLNEAETLETCIRKAQTFLSNSKINGEIVIGDSGSIDGSLEIAARMGVKIVKVFVLGYGAALSYAIREAKGKYIIMADSDDSYDFENLEPLLIKLREGSDLVMGNRFKGNIKENAMPWKNRWIGNPILTGIGRILFRSKVGDFHCGLRGFSKVAFTQMNLKSTGMEFASEMVIKASLFGLKQSEVPVTLSKDGRSRLPHLKPWRDGWRHLRLMLLFSPRWLFLYPGFFSIFLSFILGCRIIMGTFQVGIFNLDINTLIYSGALLLIGFQSVCFAIFTKIFSIQEGLHHSDPKLDKLFKYITLETGIIIGSTLFLLGLGALIYEFSLWQKLGFAELNPAEVVRITYPSSIAMVLGFQIILSSFFLSVLGLKLDRK